MAIKPTYIECSAINLGNAPVPKLTDFKIPPAKTIGLKILHRGPVTRFRRSSFSCNQALLFHTWHCLSPQIFSRQWLAFSPFARFMKL